MFSEHRAHIDFQKLSYLSEGLSISKHIDFHVNENQLPGCNNTGYFL